MHTCTHAHTCAHAHIHSCSCKRRPRCTTGSSHSLVAHSHLPAPSLTHAHARGGHDVRKMYDSREQVCVSRVIHLTYIVHVCMCECMEASTGLRRVATVARSSGRSRSSGHTCTHAHMHTCTQYAHSMHTVCTHAHMHTCAHAHMHPCTHAQVRLAAQLWRDLAHVAWWVHHPLGLPRCQAHISPTSTGPHVSLVLTSPGPHVLLVWQARLRRRSMLTRP